MKEDKSTSEVKKSWTYDDFPEIEENRKEWEKERLTQRIMSFNRKISELVNDLVYQGFNVLTTRTHNVFPLCSHQFNKHNEDISVSYHLETELDDGNLTVILAKYENSKPKFSKVYVNYDLDEVIDEISKTLKHSEEETIVSNLNYVDISSEINKRIDNCKSSLTRLSLKSVVEGLKCTSLDAEDLMKKVPDVIVKDVQQNNYTVIYLPKRKHSLLVTWGDNTSVYTIIRFCKRSNEFRRLSIMKENDLIASILSDEFCAHISFDFFNKTDLEIILDAVSNESKYSVNKTSENGVVTLRVEKKISGDTPHRTHKHKLSFTVNGDLLSYTRTTYGDTDVRLENQSLGVDYTDKLNVEIDSLKYILFMLREE